MLTEKKIRDAVAESNDRFEQEIIERYTDENSTDEWKADLNAEIQSQLTIIDTVGEVIDPFDNSTKWNFIIQIRDWKKCYFLTDEESLENAVIDFMKERGMENRRLRELKKNFLNGTVIH